MRSALISGSIAFALTVGLLVLNVLPSAWDGREPTAFEARHASEQPSAARAAA